MSCAVRGFAWLDQWSMDARWKSWTSSWPYSMLVGNHHVVVIQNSMLKSGSVFVYFTCAKSDMIHSSLATVSLDGEQFRLREFVFQHFEMYCLEDTLHTGSTLALGQRPENIWPKQNLVEVSSYYESYFNLHVAQQPQSISEMYPTKNNYELPVAESSLGCKEPNTSHSMAYGQHQPGT